jgi:hypothetical protein
LSTVARPVDWMVAGTGAAAATPGNGSASIAEAVRRMEDRPNIRCPAILG